MGPLVTREHRDKVASYIGADDGATIVVDGRDGAPDDGFFLAPTLIDDIKPGMKAYDDEIFGPVLGVTRVDTYEEAVGLINDNPYGNGTAIFTRDGGVAQLQFDVSRDGRDQRADPGTVAYYSFGGWKACSSVTGTSTGRRARLLHPLEVVPRWPDPATSSRPASRRR
jgi:malonate-semialdehyde dehydrogenase (acetylating)/methylmalonate-semialdehyde dehydrogenase